MSNISVTNLRLIASRELPLFFYLLFDFSESLSYSLLNIHYFGHLQCVQNCGYFYAERQGAVMGTPDVVRQGLRWFGIALTFVGVLFVCDHMVFMHISGFDDAGAPLATSYHLNLIWRLLEGIAVIVMGHTFHLWGRK